MQDSTPSLFTRFSGERLEALSLDALKDQKLILGNKEAAEELFARGRITYFYPGDFLTVEDEWSNSILFLLAGRVEISISGFKVAERSAGQHVGEMALIDPSQPRAASAIALEPTVALLVNEEDFSAVAAHHPDMWRQIAKEIAQRLRQRRKFIRPSNPVPFVFVACAAESLDVAKVVSSFFDGRADFVIEIWTDSVFKPSKGTMESLEAKLNTSDFALAIFSADDTVVSRGAEKNAPRDNTVFELGLFAGALGRERSFFMVENDANVKIPSDLAGITSLRYKKSPDGSSGPDVSEACMSLEERIASLGPR
jgi:CRP/FNR family transcriptional regulator, cyclic AMP receptor protein